LYQGRNPELMIEFVLICFLGLLGSEPTAKGTGEEPVPTFFAGRANDGDCSYVLDLNPSAPRVICITSAGKSRAVRLGAVPWKIERSGLARSTDGLLWVLADRGKKAVGFDPGSGKPVTSRELEGYFQAIWDSDGQLLLARLPMQPNELLLARLDAERVEALGTLKRRSARVRAAEPILDLLTCAGGALRLGGVGVCWWLAGSDPVCVLAADGSCHHIDIRTTARVAEGASGSAVERSFTYPIRDIYPVTSTLLWALTNQEGKSLPFESPDQRSRHLIRVQSGSPQQWVELKKPGRAILRASDVDALVLFADGTIEKVIAR
jgi:hypothetical protein